MEAREIALLAAKVMDDKRGKDIIALKVDELTIVTDYLVIATGRSVPQVKALADGVEEELEKHDIFPRHREGLTEGRWCVLDYGDVMVHIFHEQDREYYQMERLWADGTNELDLGLNASESED